MVFLVLIISIINFILYFTKHFIMIQKHFIIMLLHLNLVNFKIMQYFIMFLVLLIMFHHYWSFLTDKKFELETYIN